MSTALEMSRNWCEHHHVQQRRGELTAAIQTAFECSLVPGWSGADCGMELTVAS